MKTQRIETEWLGNMQFQSTIGDHKLLMDAAESSGGENKGVRPKPLLLSAVSGCSGLDVAAILKKARKPIDHLSISAEADLSEGHPSVYTTLRMVYDFRGPEESREMAIKAVKLSQQTYCGVSAMLKKAMELKWTIVYNGVEVASNNS